VWSWDTTWLPTTVRGSTMISTLQWPGVAPSFSRPHVSDDNPYSEALFRTLKHTPAYPRLPYADLASANHWVGRFVDWYNGTHRHSAIRYVTPDQRHNGANGRSSRVATHCTNARAALTGSAGVARREIGCQSGSSFSTPNALRIALPDDPRDNNLDTQRRNELLPFYGKGTRVYSREFARIWGFSRT
jgi:hypothetical protein